MKESFEILMMVACGLVLLVLVRELIKQGKIASEKIEDEKIKFAFNQVLDLAGTIVDSLNQTIVEPLKESETLKFDKKKQIEIKEKAKGRIKDNLDAKTKDLLKAYLGSDKKFDAFVEDAVEAKVYETKKK